MNRYYIPINGYVEVVAEDEPSAYEKARERVKGFDYYCGEATLLDDTEED